MKERGKERDREGEREGGRGREGGREGGRGKEEGKEEEGGRERYNNFIYLPLLSHAHSQLVAPTYARCLLYTSCGVCSPTFEPGSLAFVSSETSIGTA